MFILAPVSEQSAYKNAAQIFRDMYKEITGRSIDIKHEPQDGEDMIVIGSEAVQPFVYGKIDGGLPVRFNSDDYCIISKQDNGRNLLFLAGGRGRSTIYAVYDFFEKKCGCHYFWDGDVIEKEASVDITGMNVYESPRFTYRAIRYFAHRGLSRFQAEHWDFDEWKKEIDWICKSRLNTFMLRIGIDDLFQKAFPDIVDYPSNEEVLPEATTGYNDRTTFWSLEYRGQLRKKILDYAFSCDLIHPEDCGTMTHWYSRTPLQFLESVKPGFLSQSSKSQSEQTGLVWDIFDEKNMKNYQKLTDTHVKEYGNPSIFHTIGLAERTYEGDRRKNIELKKYAYRKIIENTAEKYPDALMMIATWDFYFCLQPEEVREIVKSFDPEKTMLLDYTVDLKAKGNDFENWDIMGKIPWIFGIFHAYEPQNYIHGDYEYITKKLEIASNDSFCKGMAFWPEQSHSDTLMLEYFRENAWKPQGRSIEEIASDMCYKRYGEDSKAMKEIWEVFIKTMKLPSRCYIPSCFDILKTESPFWHMLTDGHEYQQHHLDIWENHADDINKIAPEMKAVFLLIKNLPVEVYEKPFIHRDVCDMIKSILVKKLHYNYIQTALLYLDWKHGKDVETKLRAKLDYCDRVMDLFADALNLHEDNSMYQSFVKLGKNRTVNPHFENTLKENVVNWYCRTSAYEVVKYVYKNEVQVFRNWVLEQLDTDNKAGKCTAYFEDEKKKIFGEFKKIPLSDMTSERLSYKVVLEKLLEL